MPTFEFNPPMVDRLQAQTRPFVPANTENFLADVCRPELSLAELAKRYSTTVDALSVWLSRPDVLQRLAEIRSVSAQRAGFIAGMHLPHYAHSLELSLKQAVTESDFLGHLTLSLESNTLRVRYRENIRKTVALLTNIARFERTATRWGKHRDPKPKPTEPTTPTPKNPIQPSPPSNPPRPSNSPPPSSSPRPPTAAQIPRPSEVRGTLAQPSAPPIRANSNAPSRTLIKSARSRPAPKRAQNKSNPNPRAAPPRASAPARAATSARRSTSPSASRPNSPRSRPTTRPTTRPTPHTAAPPASKRPRGRPSPNKRSNKSSNNSHQSTRNSQSRRSQALPGPAP